MINDICILLIAHFIGDFLTQTREIAKQKSESMLVLTLHAALYTFAFSTINDLFVFNEIHTKVIVGKFTAFNFFAHLITDFITSRVNKFTYKKFGPGYLFFSGIGLDQLIHSLTIILTYEYFFVR